MTRPRRRTRTALLDTIRASVPYDFYVWLLTDPTTSVGSSPVAHTPRLSDLAKLVRLKYLTPLNRWTSLEPNRSVTLVDASRGDPAQSLLWRELLGAYGVTDVMTTTLGDAFGRWGFLELWRTTGTFGARERATLDGVAPLLTGALRQSLIRTFTIDSAPPPPPAGPAVLLFAEDLESDSRTPATDAYLRSLLPTEVDHAPVPAAAYNVAAQLLAVEQGIDGNAPSASVTLGHGHWVTLRAARIASPTTAPRSIAVTIESTPPAVRTSLYSRVCGLTERETTLLENIIDGSTSHAIANRLGISEHTVQDHLKSIFRKSGAKTRRVLSARATGAA